MNQPNTHQFLSRRSAALASLFLALILGGCALSSSASSNTAANADANSRASSSSKSGSHAGAHASGSANISGKSSAKTSGSASGRASGGSKFVFTSKSRVSGVAKAKKEDHFKATVLVGGGKAKGNASASIKAGGSASAGGSSKTESKGSSKTGGKADGKGSIKVSTSGKGGASAGGSSKSQGKGSIKVSASGKGSASAGGSSKAGGKGSTKTGGKGASNEEKAASTKPSKEKPSKEKPSKEKPSKEKPSKEKPSKEKPSKEKPSKEKPSKEKPSKEKPEPVDEPIVVIEPPEAPPENVFGYETPVRGCFEGVVYPIASNSKSLPTDWNALTGISVVYACEWDIPTREWELGFPGVEDRFEWFAIQYSGSFSIETAGKWKFRISSDDGTKLYIDGELVLDNDGVHPPEEKEIELDLTAGDHEMVLEYFQGPRYHINLQVYATPPGGEEGIFSVR